jgi:hypothetical protein
MTAHLGAGPVDAGGTVRPGDPARTALPSRPGAAVSADGREAVPARVLFVWPFLSCPAELGAVCPLAASGVAGRLDLGR